MKNGTKCLVYSFGVGEDFTFDDAMAKRGCEVHSFDPCKFQLSGQYLPCLQNKLSGICNLVQVFCLWLRITKIFLCKKSKFAQVVQI